MRYYETLYIVNPNFEESRLQNIIGDITKEIEKYSFSVINHRVWGKKRLAFSISKHKYGTYILLQFGTAEPKHLPEYETNLKLNKTILRSQTVKLDEKPEAYLEEIRKDDEEEAVAKPAEAPSEPSNETKTDNSQPAEEDNEAESREESEPSEETPLEEEQVEEASSPESEDVDETQEVEKEEA